MGSISGETIRRAASGDHGAFNEIYRAYEGGLRAYITSHINDKSQAEDVLQNTFVAVFKNIGQLKNPDGLKTWLYKIAYNECMSLNGVTKRETERYTPLSSFADEDGSEREFEDDSIELPEDFATNAELQKLLAKTLNSLPKNQRDCLVLYYYRQKPIAEIAQMLGVSENAVKLRKKSALERLKRKLEKYRKNYNFAFAPMGLLLHKLVGTGKVKSAYTGAAVVRTAGASLAAACAAGVIGVGAIGYFGIMQDKKYDEQRDDSSIIIDDSRDESEQAENNNDTIIDYTAGNFVDLGVGSEVYYSDPAAHPLARYNVCSNEKNESTFVVEVKSFKQNLDDNKIYVEYSFLNGNNPFGDLELTAKLYTLPGNGYSSYAYCFFSEENLYNQSTGNYLAVFDAKKSFNEMTQSFLSIPDADIKTDQNANQQYCYYEKEVMFGVGTEAYMNSLYGPVIAQYDKTDEYGLYKKSYVPYSSVSHGGYYENKEGTKNGYYFLYDENEDFEEPFISESGEVVINENVCYAGSNVFDDVLSFYDQIVKEREYVSDPRYPRDDFWNNEKIKNVRIINNKHYRFIDDVLYYTFENGILYLVWTPEINTDSFVFPDNLIMINKETINKIHADTYDFGNNDWLAEYYSKQQ